MTFNAPLNFIYILSNRFVRVRGVIVGVLLTFSGTFLRGAVTTRVDVTYTNSPALGYSSTPSMSGDGRFVVFQSYLPSDLTRDLDPVSATNSSPIYLRDRQIGRTFKLRNVPASGSVILGIGGHQPIVSGDGRFAAFTSDLYNFTTFVTTFALYRYPTDNVHGSAPQNIGIRPDGGEFNSILRDPAFSYDGRYIVFATPYPDPGVDNIYMRDLNSNVTELISKSVLGNPATNRCSEPSVSADGRYVAFSSSSRDLISDALPDGIDQIYLRDRQLGTNILVTRMTNDLPATNWSSQASVSADGKWVVFASTCGALAPGGRNDVNDLYIFEVASGNVTRLGGSVTSGRPKISGDGRFVAFTSSQDLLPGDRNDGGGDVYVIDRDSESLKRASVSSRGEASDQYSGSGSIGITDDGRYVCFASSANNLTLNGPNGIYVHDFGGLFNDHRLLGTSGDNPTTLFGDSDQPFSRVGLPEYEVNTSTLNLALRGTLFRMKTRGPSMGVTLTYNAAPFIQRGAFGNSWSHGYESSMEISFDGRQVHLRRGAGQVLTFTSPVNLRDSGLSYPVELTPPPGVHDQMFFHEDHTIYRRKSNRFEFRYEGIDNSSSVRRLISTTDRNANTVALTVNLTNGIIDRITAPDGRFIELTHNAEGLCTRIKTPAPDTRDILFTYDANRNLTQIRSLDARYSAFYQYDDDGYMTQMNNAGRITTFTYSSRGIGAGTYVTQVNDAASGITHYDLIGQNPLQVRRTTRDGKQIIFKANADGRTEQIADPLNHIRSIGYTAGLPTSFTDANGKISNLEYDARGNVIRQVDALNKETVFTYDADDNLLTRKNALNETTTYFYDANHNLTKVRTPLGHETVFTLDAFGQVVSAKDSNNNITGFTYDTLGNMTSVTDPLNNTTSFTFDAAGLRCIRMTDARGNVKHLEHDPLDRLTQIGYGATAPGTVLLRNVFDAFDQKEFYDELGNKTRVERNGHGYITRIIPPLGNATRYEYNADNLQTGVVDPLDRRASTLFDDAGRPTRNTNRRGFHVDRLYDDEGNLSRLRDQRSNDTLFTYDDNNRSLTTQDPLGRTVTHTRDAIGRITRTTNARGQTIDFIYDADGRLVRKDHNGSTFASYAHDPAGNLTQVVDATGTTTYSYDSLNRVIGIQYPDALNAGFAYDAVGNLTSITYPGGFTVSYTFDNFNRTPIPAQFRNGTSTELLPSSEKRSRATSISWGGNNVTFQFDAAARMTRETRSNSTWTDYTYDGNGRMTSISHRNNQGEFLRLVYPYDAANRSVGELATPEFVPDLPPASIAATYNAANQIVNWGGDSYSYDLDGNLATIGGNKFSGAYDPENRLTSMTVNSVTTTHAYNGNGERISKITGSQTRIFHYNPAGQLLFETDGGTTPTVYYLYANGRLMAAGTPTDGFKFYHFNKTGHTMALSDGNGNVATRYAYQPFGAATSFGAPTHNPFKYVGAFGVMDDGDGILFMRNRHYGAQTGKFLQKDPIGFDGGINLYAYANSSPFDYADPNGTIAPLVMLYWTGAAVGATLTYEWFFGEKKQAEESLGKITAAQDEAERLSEKYATGDPTKDGYRNANQARVKPLAGAFEGTSQLAGQALKNLPARSGGEKFIKEGLDAAENAAGWLENPSGKVQESMWSRFTSYITGSSRGEEPDPEEDP